MKRKPRKLALNRETIRLLEERSLSRVRGLKWSNENCTDLCDTDFECSTGCDQPTNIYHAC